MKNLACITLLLISLFSCKETPKNTSVSEAPKEVVSDSTAIANTIHGFYKWYKDFVIDTTKSMAFAYWNITLMVENILCPLSIKHQKHETSRTFSVRKFGMSHV